MNNEFLLDEEFIQLTKKSINEIKQTYASTPYHPDFVNVTNKNLDLMISPSMFCETALVTLRGIIINFARIEKRNKNRAIKTLEARIRELDDKVCCGEANIQDFNQLTNLNNDLVNLHKSELQGTYIRSRAESLEFGEKPSKFFLNIESRNRVNKTITEIKIDENNTITAHKHILDSLKNFYETLYKVQDLPKPENVNVPIPTQLTDQEKTQLESALTKEELDKALKQLKNKKSPGIDGYSPEFFKKFWPQLGHFYLDCINECYKNGQLTDSLSQGIITCLPNGWQFFQNKSNSRIILNGYLSEPFPLQWGCRQGDPISQYLFILCSEFLTLAIKNNRNIEGITVYNRKEHKMNLYADDTSIFLKATEQNLRNHLETLQWFYQISGLKINISKTKVIRIGPIRETDRRFCRENNLEWVHNFNALGINYDTMDIENITDQNINEKLESMNKLMQLWICQNITPSGRITVFKSLILSKITHILQSLPSPRIQTMNWKKVRITSFGEIKDMRLTKLFFYYPWRKEGKIWSIFKNLIKH